MLGSRLAAWGAVAGRGLPDAGRPVLARLGATTGESAQLYVREGDHRVCVAVHERPSGLRDTVPSGAVLPLERGSGRQGAPGVGDRRGCVRRQRPRAGHRAPQGLGRERRRTGGRSGERERAGVRRGRARSWRRSVSAARSTAWEPSPDAVSAPRWWLRRASFRPRSAAQASPRTSRRGNKGVTKPAYRSLRERRGRPMAR